MLTPIDIQNHVLKSTMGGYNKKETDDFIESIQQSYEQLYKENHELKENVTTLSEGIQYYRQMEGTLQKTLMLAEKTATETLEASRTKASKVEKESQEKASVMLTSAKEKADSILSEAEQKANTMLTESEEKSNTLLTESQEKADRLLAESKSKADTTVSEAQQKADSLISVANERVERVLADAKESAGTLLKETKTDTEKLLKETKENTEKLLSEANVHLADVSSTMKKLISCYDDYKEQFKSFLQKQLDQLEDPSFSIQVPDLEETLESQQVAIAEKEREVASKMDDLTSMTDELDEPVEAILPEKPADTSADMDWGQIGGVDPEDKEESSEAAATREDLVAELSTNDDFTQKSIEVTPEDAVSSAPSASEAETPQQEVDANMAAATPSLEALAAMASSMSDDGDGADASASNTEDNEEDIQRALESLRKANTEVIPKAPVASDESSMLGTSYDDFVPASQQSEETAEAPAVSFDAEAEQPAVPMPDFARAAQEVSFEAQPEQPVVPMPDFARAAQEVNFEAQPEQPTVPMPDFARAAQEVNFEAQPEQPTVPMPDFARAAQEVSFEAQPEQPVVPMPDFARAAQEVDFEAQPEQPVVPMPDFARAAQEVNFEAQPEQPTVPMPDFSGAAQNISFEPEAAASEEVQAESYATSENLFGSADNAPYTGSATDFDSGITGPEEPGNTEASSASSELFSADFSGVSSAPVDEFAVSNDPAPSGDDTPFTFIDAN